MLWLADENVEVETVRGLRHTGYEVNAIRETCPGVLDPEVMRIAEEDDCVIITEDLGFGEMVFKDRMSTVGVVLLRQHAGTPATRAQNLLERMPLIEQHMPGWFVVVEDGNTRWRKLRQ